MSALLIVVTLRLIGLGAGLLDPARKPTGRGGATGQDHPTTSLGNEPVAAPVEIVEAVLAWSVPILGVVAGLASVHWLHRVWGNWATQGKPRHDEHWVVLAWFVPLLNLWRPAGIVRDMFADRPGMRTTDGSAVWVIALWWIPGVLGVAGTVLLLLRGDWFPSTTNADGQLLVTHLLLAISAAAGLWLISELTDRHEVRSQR